MLLRPCTVAENRALSSLSVHTQYPSPDRPTTPRAARAAHRCRPAASGQRAQHPKPLQAAPARKQLALRNKRFRPSTQAARGPGAAMVLARIGCHRAPFGSFPRVGKNTPHARAAGKGSPHLTGATQAHHLARNEGGPPVPPGRQRTTDITPKAVPSRPREEGLSLAQQKVSHSTQAARGPGAAMVLSRIGCHRAPFGSFPRVGKNAPHGRAAGKGTAASRRANINIAPRE